MKDLYDRLAIEFGDTDPVLDLGTGSGAVAAELIQRGVRLCLLDVVDLRDRPVPAAPYVLGDGCALPIRTGVLAGVHLGNVLHHLPDWRRAMAEAARVLTAEGLVAIGSGGMMPDGVLGELVDSFYAATDAAGYRSLHKHDPHDISEVDRELAGLGFGAPELAQLSWLSTHRPAEFLAGRVEGRYRWDPAQDQSGLPAIADRVLAASGLDPDAPVGGHCTMTYRLYRRIGRSPLR